MVKGGSWFWDDVVSRLANISLRHFSQHEGADEGLIPTPLLEYDIRQRSRETAAQNRKGW